MSLPSPTWGHQRSIFNASGFVRPSSDPVPALPTPPWPSRILGEGPTERNLGPLEGPAVLASPPGASGLEASRCEALGRAELSSPRVRPPASLAGFQRPSQAVPRPTGVLVWPPAPSASVHLILLRERKNPRGLRRPHQQPFLPTRAPCAPAPLAPQPWFAESPDSSALKPLPAAGFAAQRQGLRACPPPAGRAAPRRPGRLSRSKERASEAVATRAEGSVLLSRAQEPGPPGHAPHSARSAFPGWT